MDLTHLPKGFGIRTIGKECILFDDPERVRESVSDPFDPYRPNFQEKPIPAQPLPGDINSFRKNSELTILDNEKYDDIFWQHLALFAYSQPECDTSQNLAKLTVNLEGVGKIVKDNGALFLACCQNFFLSKALKIFKAATQNYLNKILKTDLLLKILFNDSVLTNYPFLMTFTIANLRSLLQLINAEGMDKARQLFSRLQKLYDLRSDQFQLFKTYFIDSSVNFQDLTTVNAERALDDMQYFLSKSNSKFQHALNHWWPLLEKQNNHTQRPAHLPSTWFAFKDFVYFVNHHGLKIPDTFFTLSIVGNVQIFLGKLKGCLMALSNTENRQYFINIHSSKALELRTCLHR